MTAPARPPRFGLVGTGHWARITHAPALASTEGIDFAAVWGRTPDAAAALAAEHAGHAYAGGHRREPAAAAPPEYRRRHRRAA